MNKEGLLRIVEPNKNVSNSHLEKSSSNLKAAKILLEQNLLEESISMTYYSMYNILISLLFKCGIKSENHSASIIILKEVFKIDNSLISNAKKERIDSQYYTDFNITKNQAQEAIRTTEDFNTILYSLISTLSTEEINKIREKLKELI